MSSENSLSLFWAVVALSMCQVGRSGVVLRIAWNGNFIGNFSKMFALPPPSHTCAPKTFLFAVYGGPSSGSSIRRPGREDPHLAQLNFLLCKCLYVHICSLHGVNLHGFLNVQWLDSCQHLSYINVTPSCSVGCPTFLIFDPIGQVGGRFLGKIVRFGTILHHRWIIVFTNFRWCR